MPLIIISEICYFIEVKDINNLSLVNKKMNEKTNIIIYGKNFFIINMIKY